MSNESDDYDKVIPLFEGKINDEILIEIWKGSEGIFLLLNGFIHIGLSDTSLSLLRQALEIADQKNNPK